MSSANDLSRMHIDDLVKKFNAFKKLVEQDKLSSQKKVEIEEELCYIQRELDLRQINQQNS